MADKELYIKLSGGSPEVELGPFPDQSLGFSPTEAMLEGVQFANVWSGYWRITDGSVLGDERLTGTDHGVILGQAKISDSSTQGGG